MQGGALRNTLADCLSASGPPSGHEVISSHQILIGPLHYTVPRSSPSRPLAYTTIRGVGGGGFPLNVSPVDSGILLQADSYYGLVHSLEFLHQALWQLFIASCLLLTGFLTCLQPLRVETTHLSPCQSFFSRPFIRFLLPLLRRSNFLLSLTTSF